jgi:preprotein translocase subunit YajC
MSFSFQTVPAKAGTPGVEQPSGPPAGGGAPSQGSPPSMITMLLPFLILVPFLFFSMRRNKAEKEARAKLKKGDKVVAAGIIGELVDVDEKIAKVKIAPGTTVQVLATSISSFETAAPEKKTDKELSDLKEAKAAAEKK